MDLANILVAALVIITAYYAWATRGILKANERLVRVMQDQAEETTRPYITVSVLAPPNSIILYLRIANTGRTAAYSLRLALDRDFFRYGTKEQKDNLRTFNAFREEIQCFPPGAELIFALAQAFVIFGDEADPQRTPRVFNVTASYTHSGKKRTETTTIDLNPYFLSNMPPDPTLDELRRIREELEHIRKETAKLQQTLANRRP